MKLQIALLRGINVGGKNSLPMRELVEIFHSMSCENVQTYIQSGNVVFQSKKNWGEAEAEELRRNISLKKGFAPHVVILGERDLLKAIEKSPFQVVDGKALHFFFLDSKPKQPNLERLAKLKAASEEFSLVEKVLYLRAPNGIARSKLAPAVESTLGVPTTARNLNTVEKLASMLEKA